MRPLTDEECKVFFEKLSKYIGENIKQLLERPDGKYCFRFHKDRVYYSKENLMKKAGHISRENLLGFGTCFGKFTKSGKFRLHITALDFLAPYAKYKIWLKPNAEQQFLYGNHVMKAGLGRITEATQQFQGVVVYSMSDLPLMHNTGKELMQSQSADCSRILVSRHKDIHEEFKENFIKVLESLPNQLKNAGMQIPWRQLHFTKQTLANIYAMRKG